MGQPGGNVKGGAGGEEEEEALHRPPDGPPPPGIRGRRGTENSPPLHLQGRGTMRSMVEGTFFVGGDDGQGGAFAALPAGDESARGGALGLSSDAVGRMQV